VTDPVRPAPSAAWSDRLADRWADILGRLPDRRPLVVGGVVAIVGALALAGVLFLSRRSPPAAPLTLPRAAPGAPAPANGGLGGGAPGAPEGPEKVTVDAAGAVAHPGVYTVPAGSRVADVVAAAGGPAPDADPDQLNLAAKVGDADRVYMPRKGEMLAGSGSGPAPAAGNPGAGNPAAGGPGAKAGGQVVDLNSATPEQLDALPGVGPSLAQAIVTYRTRHVRFRSVEELDQVPGIGPAKLATLRPLVRV
jgi:competence protein ComEA